MGVRRIGFLLISAPMAAHMIGHAELPLLEHSELDEFKLTPGAGSELQPNAIVKAHDSKPDD